MKLSLESIISLGVVTGLLAATATSGHFNTAPAARAGEGGKAKATTAPEGEVVKRTLCVYEPTGKESGPIYQQAKNYLSHALAKGVDFTLKLNDKENVVADDLKAKACDAALMTGVRIRDGFNPFTGSLESMGALPEYATLKGVIQAIRAKGPDGKAYRKLLKHGNYQVAAIFPGGKIFLFLRDRSINTVEKLAGKSIATLSNDPAAQELVNHVKATATPVEITNFSKLFNNGTVDACYAPATAFKSFELFKGLGEGAGEKGGIPNYTLAQLSIQLVLRVDSGWPKGFATKAFSDALKNFDQGVKTVEGAEKDPLFKKYLFPIDGADRTRYDAMFREVRGSLRDKGVYHGKMLELMWRVRCNQDKTRAECAAGQSAH